MEIVVLGEEARTAELVRMLVAYLTENLQWTGRRRPNVFEESG